MTDPISGKDAMMLGAFAKRAFTENGGFTSADRDNIIEAINAAVPILQGIVTGLLDDPEGTLDWVTLIDIQALNSAGSLIESARKAFVFNAIMIQGGKLMLEDLRKDLLKEQ